MLKSILCSLILTKANCNGIKRADQKELHEIFLQFATETSKNGEKLIRNEDFIRKFLGLYENDNYNRDSVNLIATIVDTNNDGYISFSEFQEFEKLLCAPDALYRTGFQLFRKSENDYVSYEDFVYVMEKSVVHQKLPFDFDSTFIHLYFGQDKGRVLVYQEFGQFLHDYHHEYALEAFLKYNKNGFIDVGDFKDIMLTIKNHLMSDAMKTKVINSKSFPEGKQRVSFAYYMAFISLLKNMELFKRVHLYATNGDKRQFVSKEQFLQSAQMISQITPLEIDILYTLCDIIHKTNGNILYHHLRDITPEQYYRRVKQSFTEIKAVSSPEERSIFILILESAYRFLLGAVAGCFGAATVYPIDFVKTRIQNQRIGPNGEKLYANYMDCFKKVIQNEGVRGLYKGLTTQLAGVAPEKAIKLSVIPRKGQTQYDGIIDAIKKIYSEEGIKAFYKGTLARVCRSSPQFGVTLATYELLQRLFFIDFGGTRPAGSELRILTPVQETTKKAHHIGGYQVAVPVLTGLETKFGISLPRFSYPKP